MSKIIFVCKRSGTLGENTEKHLKKISDELVPDNLTKVPMHQIKVYKSIAYAMMMCKKPPVSGNGSVLLGNIFRNTKNDYLQPGSAIPDGNYALFRNDDNQVEVISDAAGTRTVWYYKDEDYFLASTSQRAIIMFLGDFIFNENVIPWMFSTGSLGPSDSWDRRVKRLQADATLTLNKTKWRLNVTKREVDFSVIENSKASYTNNITSAIRRTIKNMNFIDYKTWILPLSGGYDSRAILCFLREIRELPDYFRTVTWGLENSVTEEGNDAKIAVKLAEQIGVKHQYYHTDLSSEPVQLIVDRFVKCGEGRIDHLAAYMDGLEIWRRFHDEGIEGVIRGDEGFGWSDVSSDLTVRLNIGCALCNDFKNLRNLNKFQNFPIQELPSSYHKKESESIEQWRDRLYHIYRLPTILAALSDIKFSYVEQINPLLSSEILYAVRKLPDVCRTNKALFKEIVKKVSPDIPMATRSANDSTVNILRSNTMVQLIRKELATDLALSLFTPEFLKFVCDEIKEKKIQVTFPNKSFGIIASLKRFIPQKMRFWFRNMGVSPSLDGNKFAFRVFIILRMNQILNQDKDLLKFHTRK